MKRNSTIAWACAASILIGACGCSTSNPFKKKAPATPPAGELPYKPGDVVPTPGTPMAVTGTNPSANSNSIASTSTGGPSYPSTGVGATPIGNPGAPAQNWTARPGEMAKPAFNPHVPASAAKAGNAPAWTPPATANNNTPAAPSQEGYYPTNYPGTSTTPNGGVAAIPASTPLNNTNATNSAQAGPFSAPTISGGSPEFRTGSPPMSDIRTADTRSNIGTSPWAAKGEGSPASGSPAPWVADGGAPVNPGTSVAPTGPEAWASNAGRSAVGQDAARSVALRPDRHYRPGQTSDYQNNGPLIPNGAQSPPSASPVVPAGFSTPNPDALRRSEKPIAEAPPASGSPWGNPAVTSVPDDTQQYRRYEAAPPAQGDSAGPAVAPWANGGIK